MDDVQRQKILIYLQDHSFCVISTVDDIDTAPESAFVRYASDGFDLFINTFHFSRKVPNIQKHPNVAIVIADPENRSTLQIQGEAQILSGDSRNTIKELYTQLYPLDWAHERDHLVDWIHIRPFWMHYINLFNEQDVHDFVVTDF